MTEVPSASKMAAFEGLSRTMPDTMFAACSVPAAAVSSNTCTVIPANMGTTMSAATMSAATMSAATVSATTVSATTVSATTVSAANMTAANVSAATMSAANVTAATMSAANVTAATVSAATVSAAASAGVCRKSDKSEKRHYQEQRSGHASSGHQYWHCNVARLCTHRRCQLARIPWETKSF